MKTYKRISKLAAFNSTNMNVSASSHISINVFVVGKRHTHFFCILAIFWAENVQLHAQHHPTSCGIPASAERHEKMAVRQRQIRTNYVREKSNTNKLDLNSFTNFCGELV